MRAAKERYLFLSIRCPSRENKIDYDTCLQKVDGTDLEFLDKDGHWFLLPSESPIAYVVCEKNIKYNSRCYHILAFSKSGNISSVLNHLISHSGSL